MREDLRTAIYSRVSSKQQAGDSTITSQLAALDTRVSEDDLTVLPEHRFADVSTGLVCWPDDTKLTREWVGRDLTRPVGHGGHSPSDHWRRGDGGDHAMPSYDPETSARLARLPFLQGADPAALREAARLARWIALRREEQAVSFGDATDDVFVVVEGAVRVAVQTRLGQEMIFGDLGVGELFGEMSAVDGASRSASVTALHPTRLCRLPAAAFLDVALRSPAVGRRLLRMLVDRLRVQDKRTLELATLSVRLRLVAELLRLSRPREGGVGGRAVSPPPPQHVLAARIGSRREVISRELGALARAGLVEVGPRAILLPRPDALHVLVDEHLRDSGREETSAPPAAGTRS